jgi:hypothetical protein
VTLDELGDFWINLVVGFGRRIESTLATDDGTSPLGGSWALLAGRYHQLFPGYLLLDLGRREGNHGRYREEVQWAHAAPNPALLGASQKCYLD